MSSANYAKESEKVQRTPITNAWRSRTPSASLDLKISLRERRKENFHSIVVCEVRPQKEDPNHTCITVAGSGICYPENIGTPIGSLDLFNLMINRVLSRHNAHFVWFDLKNFYLQTPMDRPEYLKIKLLDIPQEFIEKYNPTQLVHTVWIYFEILCGCYGLPHSGRLTNDLLHTRLDKAG